jgi:poly(ADP-ribose) glycohydrolase ARH3
VGLALTSSTDGDLSAPAFVDELIRFSRTKALTTILGELRRLLAGEASPEEAASALGRGVAVQESLPYALYAFLSFPDSFEDCLFCAVLHGGDCDTLGAMACAVAGARCGLEAIPERWRIKLENHRRIEDLAAALWEARQK